MKGPTGPGEGIDCRCAQHQLTVCENRLECLRLCERTIPALSHGERVVRVAWQERGSMA